MSGLCDGGAADAFALVAYLPEPLAGFVNSVRHELAPGCRLRAHITVLPPRKLDGDAATASRKLEAALARVRAFRIEVKEIKVFPVSQVIYISIEAGCAELQNLHEQLNQGPCCAAELWHFHPHVTLAQDLTPDAVARAREHAERRWREYAGPREFTLDKLAFVQGNSEHGWVDLETWELLSPVLA
jgi:2'-5' RNA ligase